MALMFLFNYSYYLPTWDFKQPVFICIYIQLNVNDFKRFAKLIKYPVA